MDQVDGQVAVITGGASGIGRAMAHAFGAAGMKVMLGDIEEAALDAAAESLRVDGVQVATQVVDVSDATAVDAFADATWSAFGGAHLVCNNAGVVAYHDAWGSLEDWKWVIDVDLWGVIHGVTSFVSRMLDSGEPGHVVNTASTAGLLGFGSIPSYVAAKHAVVGLSTSMYHQLADTPLGISVLCPGLVQTNINSSERNRPGVDPADADAPSFGLQGETLPAEYVADEVLAAVHADRFWVLPHAHYADQAVDLAERRRDGLPPLAPVVNFR